MSLVHINDEGEILDENVDANLDGSELSFDVSAFTAYVVVVTKPNGSQNTYNVKENSTFVISSDLKLTHNDSWRITAGTDVVEIKNKSLFGSTIFVKALKEGTAEITHTYCTASHSGLFGCFERCNSDGSEVFTITVSESSDQEVETTKVAVYATAGDKNVHNVKLENILGLYYNQDNGYYPVGLIELPTSMLKGEGPYINSESDWNAVKAAISEIDSSVLCDGAEVNKNNKVWENIDYVIPGYGYSGSSNKTALNEVSGSTCMGDNTKYGYHLDLQFGTNSVSYIAVCDENTINGTKLGEVDYLTNTEIVAPEDSELTIPSEYTVAGYYTTTDCSEAYSFGSAITEDSTVYVKLVKTEAMIPVAVYATDGSLTGHIDDLESILGLKYKQPDGYYPIGVVYLPKSLFREQKRSYINSTDDWNTIKAALGTIDKSKLAGDGEANKDNSVGSHLDYVQYDEGAYAGSLKTAMFDWEWGGEAYNAISLIGNTNYAYHLDLRFATGVIKYDANGATGTMTDTVQLKDTSGNITGKLPANQFTREGYTFTGWTTEKDGAGTSYTDEQAYNISANNTVLYAQWEKNPEEYTVTVNYLDDSTPANQIQTSYVDSNTYTTGQEYDVSDEIPSSITKGSDNYIFERTDRNPSGEIGSDNVVINAYYTLDNIGPDGIPDKYQISVTYKVEHGMWDDGTTADKKVVLTLLDGTVTCIVPAVGNKPDYGYEAGRWDSAPPTEYTESGTYTYTYVYEPKEVVDPIIPPFTPESVYTVTYMDGVDDEVVFEDQSTTNLKAGAKTPAFNGEPVRTGYKFIGWSPEVAETVTGDAVYYAQWKKLPEEPAVVDPSGDNDPIDDGKDIDAQPNGDADTDVEAKGVKTGDETMLAMWGALGLIAALGLGGTLVIGRRREE